MYNESSGSERDQFRQEYTAQQNQAAQQKSKKRMWLIGGVAIVALLLMGACSSYNSLNSKRENVRKMFSNVETELQNRAELIPNLVETVKGVTKQEQAVFGEIARARSQLLNPQASPNQKVEADNELSNALGRLLMLQESYPELKSNQNFLKLQDSIEGTNRRIVVGRRDYNEEATKYNTSRQNFPTVIFSNLLGFERAELFKADEGARTNPPVKF